MTDLLAIESVMNSGKNYFVATFPPYLKKEINFHNYYITNRNLIFDMNFHGTPSITYYFNILNFLYDNFDNIFLFNFEYFDSAETIDKYVNFIFKMKEDKGCFMDSGLQVPRKILLFSLDCDCLTLR